MTRILRIILISSILIIPLFVFLSYKSSQTSCLDGRGENSYYPKDIVVNTTNGGFATPKEVTESRVAYSNQVCDTFTYYIKTNGKFNKVSETTFKDFLETYNQSCPDCLAVYLS